MVKVYKYVIIQGYDIDRWLQGSSLFPYNSKSINLIMRSLLNVYLDVPRNPNVMLHLKTRETSLVGTWHPWPLLMFNTGEVLLAQ